MSVHEIDRHYLIFDRPHVYTCSCGFVSYIFSDGTEKIAETPTKEIRYLSCGHAVCCKRTVMNKDFCWICAVELN